MRKLIAMAAAMLAASPAVPQDMPEGLENAVLPTKALPAVLGSPGEIWLKGMRLRSPLLAEQAIRTSRAIVRIDMDKAGSPLPLVVVGKIGHDTGIPKDAAAQAWCDVAKGGKRYVCYQDLNGDGKLETGRVAVALHYNEPLTIAIIGPPSKLPAPIPYRAATEAELPEYRLVYESCGGGGLGDVRFIQRVRDAGGGSLDYGCIGVAKRLSGEPNGAGTLRIGRLTVDVTPKENSADTRLIAGIPAGTLLDRIMPAEPISDLGDRPPLIEELRTAAERYAKAPFQFAEAPNVRAGVVGADQVFAEGRLAWGYTGRMTKTTTINNLTSSRSIVAGAPVYGVPMGGGNGRLQPTMGSTLNLTWCAPRAEGDKWEADCMPVIAGAAHTIIKGLRPAFLVTNVAFMGDSHQALGLPEVEEGPVTFGPPVALRYELSKCTAKQATITIRSGVAPQLELTDIMVIKRGADGTISFRLGGGLFRASPVGTAGCMLQVLRPATAGGDALPHRLPTQSE